MQESDEPPELIEDTVDGDESDQESALPVLSSSEKRRVRQANFRLHFGRVAEKDLGTQLKQSEKTVSEERLSIRALLAQNEATPIITDPREYQIELFERAKSQNTIAVLDTGSGKTLIAVLLLRHIIDQELENRRQGKPRRIAFFVVPSVTLVFQQSAVLERNLDHSVDRFCGAMRCDLWTKQVWDKHLQANKVIVCTPDILYQCLMHSFIAMRDINLLIFDEAHHAKKSHTYAGIIRAFYLKEPNCALRPRIFGMTASPVDAKVDVVSAASDLEDILCSQIATTSDMALLQKIIIRPYEEIVRYFPGQQRPLESDLYRTLKRRFGHLSVIQNLFDRAMAINTHLGRWCADFYWTFALAEKKAQKLESKAERTATGTATPLPEESKESNTEIEQIKEAIALIATHNFSRPLLEISDVSNKLISLYNYLHRYFERPSDHRCIIFVEQRVVARLLLKVFELTSGPHLRPGVLTGSGSNRLDDLQATFRNQVVTLMKFRKGEFNCLFATSVAEEGLDVPDCNLIIRFDICKTMIQYVQSRGRARHKNSRLLHMLEMNNSIQDRTLQDIRCSELIMRKFCEALPADRRLIGDSDLVGGLELVDDTFTVPATGATISFGSCLQLLGHFVDCLPKDGEDTHQTTYITSSQAGKYVCEVLLPVNSPIRSVVGLVSSKKALAKRSAAFEACKQLHKGKYLDDHLVPIYAKRLPLMRNAALALNMRKTGNYTMRVKPSIWEGPSTSTPDCLYMCVLDLSDGLDRPHRPLVLLSRTALPDFPKFPLFLSKGRKTFVKLACLATPSPIAREQLDKLTTFTLRVFKDIFNKLYEDDKSKTNYWLAPAAANGTPSPLPNSVSKAIDWDIVDTVHANDGFDWSPDMPPEFLLNKFLIDKWDGGRRFFSKRLAPEYQPLDAVPENTASGKWNANILDYTVSLWKKARARTWNMHQPVIEAEKVLHRRNMLAEPDNKEDNLNSKCFLCTEPLKISAIPPEVVTTCYVFPAIIHRLDSYLIALEVCTRLGLEVDVALALEAVTKDSDSSEDNEDGVKINFQRGMGKNYERLEFLGDCFLKMATTISVFTQNPNDNEFDFHVKRMLLLCNKNLFNVGRQLNIPEYIRTQAFSRRTWYPAGLKLLEGKASTGSGRHQLGDKTIADVCEAIMGAAFLTHDRPGAWKATDWANAVLAVTKLVGSQDHIMMSWADYSRAYNKPAYQVAAATGSILDLARKVEMLHGYQFRYPRLLRSAFDHPSFPASWADGVPSYQRLEFLGDALLDMACISHIFYNYPDKSDQWLSEHKQAMCGNQFFGVLCVKLGFHKHIRQHGEFIPIQIRDYVEELESAEALGQGARDFWTDVRDPPKCLPDMVEAYVGAMFIDSDFDYNEVQRFFDEHIKPYFSDMTIYDTFVTNNPTIRMNRLFREHFGCKEYQTIAEEESNGNGTVDVIAGVMVHEYARPIGSGRAKGGKEAKARAAMAAIEELSGLPTFEFRSRYGCDCDDDRGHGSTEEVREKGVTEKLGDATIGDATES